MPALLIKILGAIAFMWVYINIFKFAGDTFRYTTQGAVIAKLLYKAPLNWFNIMLTPSNSLTFEQRQLIASAWFYSSDETFIVLKFSSITCALTGHLSDGYSRMFYSTTIVFSLFSFIGIWRFYEFLIRRNRLLIKEFAFCILFLPSIFFWASGVMKDTLVVAFMGVFLYNVDEVLIRKNVNPWKVFLIFFSFYVFASAKAYVAFALIPSLLLWFFWYWKEKIKNPALKALVTPIFIAVAIPALAGAIVYLGQSFERFNTDNILDEAAKFQDYHGNMEASAKGENGWGSAYNLGTFDGTAAGALKMFVPAVNVAIFRPYLWEARKPQVFLASLESTFLLLFTLRIFWKIGFFGFFKVLFTRPFALGAFAFAIIFAFAVGFTAYNFGALSRYRIPLLPFYMAALFIMNFEVDLKRMTRAQKVKWERAQAKKQRKTEVAVGDKL